MRFISCHAVENTFYIHWVSQYFRFHLHLLYIIISFHSNESQGPDRCRLILVAHLRCHTMALQASLIFADPKFPTAPLNPCFISITSLFHTFLSSKMEPTAIWLSLTEITNMILHIVHALSWFLVFKCRIYFGHNNMMTSSNGNIYALLALCAGNSPVTGEFPHKGQWRGALMFSLICALVYGWGWWFETPSRPLWRHFNDTQ